MKRFACIAVLIALLTGCAAEGVRWSNVSCTLHVADATAYDFQIALSQSGFESDKRLAEKIESLRESGGPVLLLVDMVAKGDVLDDPSEAVWAWVDFADGVVMSIDDAEKRRTGLLMLAGVKGGLNAAGLTRPVPNE